ncbi:MAG: glycosyltransferase family 39 protein [Hyphomicrobiales bacterium]|nr:glycosyltransferase family 39 protein [Hyphomicrobiales bacterium]
MLYVSIFVELLRSRPALAVAIAALAQAVLWTLVPTLFYAGPPGELPFVLAIGHELQLGTYLGPPLAFWLAEAAYALAGNSLFGVYVLSQICVIVTYWAVYLLGRSIVGAQHAAIAMLLMIGISAFTVPTPDFGPVTLTMALWAVILLHYWRAVNESRRGYWVALSVEIGLLFLTTYAGLLLLAVLALFTLVNRRARAAMHSTDPWLASLVAIVVLFPHLLWLSETGDGLLERLMRLRTAESALDNLNAWLRQIGSILAAHAGVAVLVSAVMGWPWVRSEPSPVIVREPPDLFGRQFVIYFALVPALAATVFAVLAGWSSPVGGIAPLVILSGLAMVLLAGNAIELRHQHIVIATWFGLLLAPPVLAVVAIFALPWVGVDLNVNKPMRPIAQFFSESFQRRTGMPLQVVAGEARSAALIALGAASRPSLFLQANPERTPWVTFEDVRRKGAIIVWPTTDTAGTPPPEIRERFPEIVPDATRVFERPVTGRLPVLRYGWAVIRPTPGDKPAGGGAQPPGGEGSQKTAPGRQ